MPINPSIIGNVMAPQAVQMPDVNAMLQTQTQGMENTFKIEAARQAAAKEEAATLKKEQEAATIKALLPAYTYGIQTGDIEGALNLAPPEMRDGLMPYVEALRGKSPEEVQAALYGSLSASPEGQEALAAIQRSQAYSIQNRQQTLSEQRLANELATAGQPKPMSAYEEAVIRLREQEAAAKAAKDAAVASGEEPPTPPQKGEVWRPEKGKFELIPGSKLYNDTSKKHAADFESKASVQDSVQESLAKIDYVLAPENKDGFEYNFGGYNAAYIGQYMPVEQAQDVKNTIESLKASITQAGLELVRVGGSIGAITEREWPLMEKQLAAVTPYVGEKRARELLQSVANRLKNIAQRTTDAYDMQWGETQFYTPSEPLPTGGGEDEGGGGGGGGGGSVLQYDADGNLIE